jgi:hypothetical protein
MKFHDWQILVGFLITGLGTEVWQQKWGILVVTIAFIMKWKDLLKS